ncbi:hypothetical protein [Variovorax boronicumulans]|uniref:hypothetical protein n=1 Tax=Variovorax boronicumulans TaxID=436515 RepID=UPI00132F8296|nr:hypothetical protein [Variovorax boronicumulans]
MTAKTRTPKAPKPTDHTPAPEGKRPRTDWDAVERDYRTGHFTNRELGLKFDLHHTAVGRKARKEGWTQDLRALVKSATSAKLIQESVSANVSAAHQSVSDSVLAAAETNKNVILTHRSDITKVRQLTMSMVAELTEVSLQQEALQEFFDRTIRAECTSPEAIMQATTAYNALTKLPARVMSVKNLSEALTKLQTLERKAFALDEEDGGGDLPAASLTDAERASRLASLLKKARKKAADEGTEGGEGGNA